MDIVFLITCLFMFIKQLPFSNTCAGYKLQVDYFRNCANNDLVEISDDFRPVLYNDCSFVMEGCVTFKETINTAMLHFHVERNGIGFNGNMNLCKMLENPLLTETQDFMQLMGIPSYCPIRKSIACGFGRQISVRKHRITFPLVAGNIKGKTILRTDVGNACFEYGGSFKKSRFFSG